MVAICKSKPPAASLPGLARFRSLVGWKEDACGECYSFPMADAYPKGLEAAGVVDFGAKAKARWKGVHPAHRDGAAMDGAPGLSFQPLASDLAKNISNTLAECSIKWIRSCAVKRGRSDSTRDPHWSVNNGSLVELNSARKTQSTAQLRKHRRLPDRTPSVPHPRNLCCGLIR
jgi:hypothetical protein